MSFTNPYFTTDLFYPNGVNLAFSPLTPFNSIVSIPLQYLFGLVASYNILCILSFILAGYGTLLLVKFLTNDNRAAFIAGLIFMFCPYHFAKIFGQLDLLSLEWIPFYILYLIKTLKEPSIKNAFLAGIFLFLTAICSEYYLIYLAVFTIITLSWYIIESKDISKKLLINLSVLSITFICLYAPFGYSLIRELIVSKDTYMYEGGFVKYSADILLVL